MPRFVVLRHELPGPPRGGVHWDLMLEQGNSLRTWTLAQEPSAAGSIDARALADHRTAYLDYEGPVSGDRGNVTRWDAGQYTLRSETTDEIAVHFKGGRLNGDAILRRSTADDQRWVFELSG